MPHQDDRGPVQLSLLNKEIAGQTTLTGIRTVWHESVANALTPERLAQVLLDIDQNSENWEYLTLAEEMEERDLHYHSVLTTRKLAVSSLDMVIESISDDAKDVEIADFVRTVINDEDTMRDLLTDSLDALGKGYAVNEIMWNRDEERWIPDHYIWRDPRFFQFDQVTGDKIRLRTEANLVDGIPLAGYKFIVHTPKIKSGLKIRGGLARLAAVAFMCKGYTLRDWMAFAEVYGMPLRVGKYGSGATPAQKAELLRAVANIGSDAAAIIPESMIIEFVDGARGGSGIGEAVFERLGNWLDRQVSKGVLGQTMTTDSGSSRSQAEVHDAVRGDIRNSDSTQLAATLRRDLIKPLVDLNFGSRKRNEYPTFRFIIEEPEDLVSLSKSLPPFIDMGLPVEASVILDKFGLEEPAKDALLLGGVTATPSEPEPELEPGPPEPEPEPEPGSPPPTTTRQTRSTASIHTEGVHEIYMAKITFMELEDAQRWLTAHDYKMVMTRETDVERIFAQNPRNLFTDQELWLVGFTRGVRFLVGKLKVVSLQQSQREIQLKLMNKVASGKTLTDDQRDLLAMLQRRREEPDNIDKLVDEEMKKWRQIMNPMLKPILDLANKAESYDEFINGLGSLANDMNADPLVRSLATATLKSRGLGDRVDKV